MVFALLQRTNRVGDNETVCRGVPSEIDISTDDSTVDAILIHALYSVR